MAEKIFEYTTKTGTVYSRVLVYGEEKNFIKETWKRKPGVPINTFNSEIDAAVYISEGLREKLIEEARKVQIEKEGEERRKSLVAVIQKGKDEKYKESNGSIAFLMSDNRIAFSTPVVSIKKIK